VKRLRWTLARGAGGSGDARKKRGEKRAEDRGLASELVRQTKWLGVASATEQKRGKNKVSLCENCGGGRNAGGRCWQPAKDVALGRNTSRRGLEW
jgi:hypothetical protein